LVHLARIVAFVIQPRMKSLAWVLLAAGCSVTTNAEQLVVPADASVLVLLVHGAGPDENPQVWANDMRDAIVDVVDANVFVHAYDWSNNSEDRVRAEGAAQAEGRAIASWLSDAQLEHVHVIAHSVGTAMAVELSQQLDAATSTHLTLLDPFGLFGPPSCASATVCQNWYNVGDGTPGSDGSMDSAFNVDVTELNPDPQGDRAHWFPPSLYAQTIGVETAIGFPNSVEAGASIDDLVALWPRGQTVVASSGDVVNMDVQR
jgi:pimeloyl-ACP methyl ester carboxylesterase